MNTVVEDDGGVEQGLLDATARLVNTHVAAAAEHVAHAGILRLNQDDSDDGNARTICARYRYTSTGNLPPE